MKMKELLISIVDDEACVRESLSSLIRSVGYKTEDFSSAESFLADGKWDETDCLIVDVRLPGMSGLELQRRLAELGHPPVVMISGHATEREGEWATRSGVVKFLRKPFSDVELLEAVRESISRTRTMTAETGRLGGSFVPRPPLQLHGREATFAKAEPILFDFMGTPAPEVRGPAISLSLRLTRS